MIAVFLYSGSVQKKLATEDLLQNWGVVLEHDECVYERLPLINSTSLLSLSNLHYGVTNSSESLLCQHWKANLC